ncbi:MAG: YbhB/YbcL family Raf kinase inhibitor-like protein [Candidatus Gracilibacteria bacterium]|nr:YbhB/YbcL family Raf kinase inhibitor-like protein [bacterium]MDZ4216853.1 YbhB/YbcL family Raf kinase inhibitor-like protein [Candidatus Gracilibacteria bacterium]
MILSSPSFEPNGSIPSQYTCDGANISPKLNWDKSPDGTKSFVLIVDDPDAIPVTGHVWDHWILYNIPAKTLSIPEHSSAGTEGMTSFGKPGYGGPCPPNGEHKYFFKLYALDTMLDLRSPDKAMIEQAMEGHVLDQAELVGLYDRRK